MSKLREPKATALIFAIAGLLGLLAANTPILPAIQALKSTAWFSFSTHDVTASWLVSNLLLALFFLLVGLELKHELITGSLNSLRKVSVPALAATFGVALPAATYLLTTASMPALAVGWAIPTATDVTFALAVFSIFGAKLHKDARTFLLGFSIIDDLIAILVIAIFFGSGVNLLWLLVLAAFAVCFYWLSRTEKFKYPAALLCLAIWFSTLESGLHPTVAGLIIAVLIPAKKTDSIAATIRPWVELLILPAFAFLALSRPLGNLEAIFGSVLFFAVASRFATKAIGITLGAWLGSLFVPKASRRLKLGDYFAVSTTGGIGFTVAFLVTETVFKGSNADAAIAATLVSSVIAITLAAICLSLRGRQVAK